MSLHLKYNASGGLRWVPCPVYKALEPEAPKRPAGEAAYTGTAAHYLSEWALTHGYGNQVDDRLIGARVRLDSKGDATEIVSGPGAEIGASYSGIAWVDNPLETTPDHPTVIEVDENMVRGVSVYTRLVSALMQKYPGAIRYLETEFKLSADMGGTADCAITTLDKIIVIDYKNGRNFVDVVNNHQLAMYGVGAYNKLGTPSDKDVVMAVVQPNSKGSPIRTWTQSIEQMQDWRDKFRDARQKNIEVERQYKLGQNIEPSCVTGSHCKWCPSAILCPAMQKQTRELVKKSPTAPSLLDEKAILWVANYGDAIIDYIGQCREYMTGEALTGKAWEGYKLVERDTKRRLTDVKELSKKLKSEDKMDGFDIKLKALSKLEKLYGKGYLAPYVEKPIGAPQLAQVNDPRKEHNETILAQLPSVTKGK